MLCWVGAPIRTAMFGGAQTIDDRSAYLWAMTDHQLALREALESFMARRVLQRLKRDEITPVEAWELLIERFDAGTVFLLLSSAR
jgi:hypothetical protein